MSGPCLWECCHCGKTDIIFTRPSGEAVGYFLAPESNELTERPQQRSWLECTRGIRAARGPAYGNGRWWGVERDASAAYYCSPECLEASLKEFLDEWIRPKGGRP
jgi:hypothetical protein